MRRPAPLPIACASPEHQGAGKNATSLGIGKSGNALKNRLFPGLHIDTATAGGRRRFCLSCRIRLPGTHAEANYLASTVGGKSPSGSLAALVHLQAACWKSQAA